MTELIADPFVQTGVLAVVGAVITRLLLRKYPAWRLLFQLVLFVALTVLLLHYGIVPYEVAASRRRSMSGSSLQRPRSSGGSTPRGCWPAPPMSS